MKEKNMVIQERITERGGGVSSVLLEWTWHLWGALQDKEDLARHV